MTNTTAPKEKAHLWEVGHPYYCQEGSYWVGGDRWHDVHADYESWADFVSEWANMDLDLNLLFRWDWQRADPADYSFELEEDPTFELPGDTVELFYMMQRKARNMSIRVKVTEADEDAVRGYLAVRAEHMRKVWEPLL